MALKFVFVEAQRSTWFQRGEAPDDVTTGHSSREGRRRNAGLPHLPNPSTTPSAFVGAPCHLLLSVLSASSFLEGHTYMNNTQCVSFKKVETLALDQTRGAVPPPPPPTICSYYGNRRARRWAPASNVEMDQRSRPPKATRNQEVFLCKSSLPPYNHPADYRSLNHQNTVRQFNTHTQFTF